MKNERVGNKHYEAIPFDFQKVDESLRKQAKVVISEIFKWFSDKKLFQWEVSRILHIIFPHYGGLLGKKLTDLIKTGSKNNADIVLSILREYRGNKLLHNTCAEFIKQNSNDGKLSKEMFIILSQTGVVTGEYGFVVAYDQKKKEIQYWKKDKNKAIRSFAKEYENYLNKQIAYEQKRADEEVEMRKRSFDN